MAPRFLSRLYGNAFTHGLTPVVLSGALIGVALVRMRLHQLHFRLQHRLYLRHHRVLPRLVGGGGGVDLPEGQRFQFQFVRADVVVSARELESPPPPSAWRRP